MRYYFSSESPLDNAERTVQLSINKSEELVWNDFTRGDNSALSFIYRKYADRLFNYGRQFAEEEIVCDAIQDLFYDMIRNRNKLGLAKSIKSYLYASLRRKIIKAQEIKNKELPQSLVEDNSAFKIAIAQEDQSALLQINGSNVQLLQEACNRLPERQREAILLYFYEQLPYEEISKIMKIGKVKSVRALVYRAVETLRVVLKDHRDELISVFVLSLVNFFE